MTKFVQEHDKLIHVSKILYFYSLKIVVVQILVSHDYEDFLHHCNVYFTLRIVLCLLRIMLNLKPTLD